MFMGGRPYHKLVEIEDKHGRRLLTSIPATKTALAEVVQSALRGMHIYDPKNQFYAAVDREIASRFDVQKELDRALLERAQHGLSSDKEGD